MEAIEAKILLKNLLQRLKKTEDGFKINGDITQSEYDALIFALAQLECAQQVSAVPPNGCTETTHIVEISQPLIVATPTNSEEIISDKIKTSKQDTFAHIEIEQERLEQDFKSEPHLDLVPLSLGLRLDTTVFDLPDAPSYKKLCIDFGTAMSKVVLITDKNNVFEKIDVLELGVAADQEEISPTMLISSVYIDADGKLRFGKMAQEYSELEFNADVATKRLDNIKRSLSEDVLDAPLKSDFNPTNVAITNRDIVLAYLTFLTWAIRKSLEVISEERNIDRRFALPCLDEVRSKKVIAELHTMLGDAQILADTFYDELEQGLSLARFKKALDKLRAKNYEYPFIKESLTEPLGVANTLLGKEGRTNSLVMVIDIGAGTTDFSMYLIGVDPEKNINVAFEIKNSSDGITEAGSTLDKYLLVYALKKAALLDDPNYSNIVAYLQLDIQSYKERLFDDGSITIRLLNGKLVDIDKDEFLSLGPVRQFAEKLEKKQYEILQRVVPKVLRPAPENVIAVVVTGGGANLPMIEDLANRVIEIDGRTIKLIKVQKVPKWISDDYEDLEPEYPRLAVAIGGARQKLIDPKMPIGTTANFQGSHELTGFYTK